MRIKMKIILTFIAILFFGLFEQAEANFAALTFDDGPKADWTEELLAVLREKNVRATFFLLGVDVKQRPDDAKKIISAGHLIGNHSMTHENLKKMPFNEVLAELKNCSELLKKLGAEQPRFMRPPGGQYNETVLKANKIEGLSLSFWTNNPGDYLLNSSGEVAEKVLRARKNGDIILLHTGLEQTVQALPSIIDGYRADGFTFVTIDDPRLTAQ